MNNTQGAMTERKQALQQLQDKVETGESDSFDEACDWFGTENTNNLIIAYNGSLDAALALHNAVLPGWSWMVADATYWVKMDENAPCVTLAIGTPGVNFRVISGHAKDPARAWLQAILSALIAEAT